MYVPKPRRNKPILSDVNVIILMFIFFVLLFCVNPSSSFANIHNACKAFLRILVCLRLEELVSFYIVFIYSQLYAPA